MSHIKKALNHRRRSNRVVGIFDIFGTPTQKKKPVYRFEVDNIYYTYYVARSCAEKNKLFF